MNLIRLFLISGLVLTAFAGRAGESPAVDDPLIPAGATVVLLCGLPGDVESETTYNDQMRAWLEILRGPARRVTELYVLSDNPAALTDVPSGSAGGQPTLMKADRTSFLDVAKVVSGSGAPVVLIAWGHGGRKSSKPVFHVRGERLTPEDLAQLAPKKNGVLSRWVLMFRTSGAFATHLAAPNRQIISSETDTMFTSDPVGMGALLNLVRAEPGLSFLALSQQFGRATVRWYEERHLARTEDPALWLGDGKPQLLAAATNESAVASAAAEAAEEPKAGRSDDRSQKKAADTGEQLTGVPEYWKSIRQVDPEQYPDTDGVVLHRQVSYTLGSNPAVATEHDEFIQILTLEGKHLADFDVSYAPPFEDITFLDCEVLQPGGKLLRLEPNAIREARERSLGDYELGSRKFFSLPGVEPGAILHVRYRVMQKTFPLPHFSMTLPVGSELPAVENTLKISLAKESAFHFALENAPAVDPAINQGSYGTTYTWAFTNLPSHLREVLAAPGRLPRLLISTFPDWRAFSEWYGRITEMADDVTPQIEKKALELTRGAKTDREKIMALYNYVTGLRYVAVPLGINSLRPHAASNVLANQYGDCKDKANLFNALLRCVAIDSHLVLVPRFTQAHDSIPGLAFNHAISRVSVGPDTLWVDTTDDVCRFGMLPPGDPGRKVLVIDGKSATLTALPMPLPKDHQLKLRSSLDCSKLDQPMDTSIEVSALGYPDYQLRTAARESRDRHGVSLPLLLAAYRPVAGSFSMAKQNGTSASALDQDFAWNASGTTAGVYSPLAGSGQFLLRAPFWTPAEWDLALHKRKSGLFLNQGYPLSLDQELQFELPANTLAVCPGTRENVDPPLRWKIQWTQPAAGKLVARLTAELNHGDLSTDETALFQQQLTALQLALPAAAALRLKE